MFKKHAFSISHVCLNDLSDLQGLQNNSDYTATIAQIKTASGKEAERAVDGNNTEFDLEAEVRNHPDSLYVKCFAIKADEMNDNGDYFSQTELKKSVGTFVGVPVFTNHQNQDIEKAKGKVVHSWWDDEQNGIMIIARVDAAAYPDIARGIKEEYVSGTSMGCSVQSSVCSACHNYSETPDTYCSCIKERKTRKISVKNQKCKYHKNGTEEQCPICGSTKGNTKTFDYDGKAFEYNYGIKFIENSFVVNPACHDCGVTEIIDPQAVLQKLSCIYDQIQQLLKRAENTVFIKTAQINISQTAESMHLLSQFITGLARVAVELPEIISTVSDKHTLCNENTCVKLAGQKELGELNQALDLLVSVSQSMLQQKDQIDLEFLKDLVGVVSDLQQNIDELTQQGYGRLQSANPGDQPGQSPAGGPPVDEQQPQSPGGPVTHSVQPGGNPSVQIKSGPAGAAGTVTSPVSAKKRVNLEKIGFVIENRKINLDMHTSKQKKVLDLQLQLEEIKKANLKIPFLIKKTASK